MANKLLETYSKNLYGTIRIFPNCPTSKELVKITGRKTFFPDDLVILYNAGFDIVVYDEQGERSTVTKEGIKKTKHGNIR